ncbi:MAG TPA: hypothetical protein VHR47_12585, partial [Bacillota bacterium]|nr:hypothetical protein [Bacillota bacterium]
MTGRNETVRRIGVTTLLLISLSTSLAWASEKLTIAYNLRPHQILTYREITTNEVIIPTKPYTIRIDKQVAYMFLKEQDVRALVALRVLSLNTAKTIDGVATPFSDKGLAQPGSELRFTINKSGLIIGKRSGDEAMVLEGLPSGPVALNQSWQTWENNGTMKSQYVVTKVIP